MVADTAIVNQNIESMLDGDLAPIHEFNAAKKEVNQMTVGLNDDEMYKLEEKLVREEAEKGAISAVSLSSSFGCFLGSIAAYEVNNGNDLIDAAYSLAILIAAVPLFIYGLKCRKAAKNTGLLRYFVTQKRYAMQEEKYAQKS